MDKNFEKLAEVFKASANVGTAEGAKAASEFAASLALPLMETIWQKSNIRELFTVETLAPGAQPSYPLDFDMVSAWFLPNKGAIAHNVIEGEEIFVPTFQIDGSIEWKLTYARDARIDVVARAMQKMADSVARKEEECGWSVIVPAALTNFAGRGAVKALPAPISEMGSSGTPAANSYLSKELINVMLTKMKRLEKELTHLYVSPEDAADIRNWTNTMIDPITRREIFQAGGMGKIWNIQLVEIPTLGTQGKFNVNSADSEFGIFQVGGNSKYGDYQPSNANVVAIDGTVTTAGESQIYGFSMTTNNSLVMPVRETWRTVEDPTLLRRQMAGVFGWEELGFACLDPRMLSVGIIDRSV